ncbi:MAG: cadherin-like domain-containing protein [Verrucomicrobiales bacterium]|nr:cadherin-like domain-containing protein [Verrucomicrobiales bacterium]
MKTRLCAVLVWAWLGCLMAIRLGAASPLTIQVKPGTTPSAPATSVWKVANHPMLLPGSHTSVPLQKAHSQPTSQQVTRLLLNALPRPKIAPALPKTAGSTVTSQSLRVATNLFLPADTAFTAVGDLPFGVPDKYAVPNDKTLAIAAPGFLANDIDLNGESITAVSIADNVDHGTLAAFADGSFTYTPNAGFTGPDTFKYRMRDASNNFSDPITVSIEVLPPSNRTPLGTPDIYALLANTTYSIAAPGFLANDIDPDGQVITAVSIQDNVDHGTLAAFADGSFNYTPNPDFTGTDSFAYRMRDASNNFSDPVLVTLVVTAGNRGPLGLNDAFAARINTPLVIPAPGFLANDFDLDGESISAVSIQDGVDHGTLAAFADGSFSYTPDAGFTGTDHFTYRMRDASNHFSDPITVLIEVYPAGLTPVGTPDQYAVPNDASLNLAAPGFLANDIDLNGEAISAVSIQDNVDHGTLAAFANGSFTYTPDATFIGTDRFSYRMRDASNNFSDPIEVIIEVLGPANRTPVGTPDLFTLRADTTLSIAGPGFLANDLDPDGETLSAVSIQDSVDHGTLAAFADGSFTYTPDPGFVGIDSFAYRMRDVSNHFSDPVTVTLIVVEGNRTPLGIADTFATRINTSLAIAAPGFLANDLDLDGETLTAVSLQKTVDHGTLSAFADGSFTYTPNPGYSGLDSFLYRMRDASNHFSDPIAVLIKVIDPDMACVDDLVARAKSGKVQLTWTHAGAASYNVYRGTASGGPYTKIGSTDSTYSTFLDGTVSNGTTYYYVVRSVNLLDQETCDSNEATVRPTRR